MSSEIIIRSGVDFALSPNLDQPKHEDQDGVVMDEINFRDEIYGLKGVIQFRELPINLDTSHPVVFPYKWSLPFYIEILVKEVTMRGISLLRTALICGDKVYEGDGEYDAVLFQKRESTDLTYAYFIDPETNESSKVLFDKEDVSKIRYLIEVHV